MFTWTFIILDMEETNMFLTNYKNVYVLHKHDRKAYPQGSKLFLLTREQTLSTHKGENYIPTREQTLPTHKGNSTYQQGSKLFLPIREQTLPTHRGENYLPKREKNLPTNMEANYLPTREQTLPTHKGANSTYPQGSKLFKNWSSENTE